MWDDSFDFRLIEASQDFIDGIIEDIPGGLKWRFTFIYGNLDFDTR